MACGKVSSPPKARSATLLSVSTKAEEGRRGAGRYADHKLTSGRTGRGLGAESHLARRDFHQHQKLIRDSQFAPSRTGSMTRSRSKALHDLAAEYEAGAHSIEAQRRAEARG